MSIPYIFEKACQKNQGKQNFLSFNEMALCNIFFEPKELAEAVMHVMDAAERADTEGIQEQLLAFSNRISAMTQEEYQVIRGLRNKQQLFSFPMPSIAKIIV